MGAPAQGLLVSFISMPEALLDHFDLTFELKAFFLRKSSFLQKLPRGGSEPINTNLAPALQSWLNMCSFSSSLEGLSKPLVPPAAVKLSGVPWCLSTHASRQPSTHQSQHTRLEPGTLAGQCRAEGEGHGVTPTTLCSATTAEPPLLLSTESVHVLQQQSTTMRYHLMPGARASSAHRGETILLGCSFKAEFAMVEVPMNPPS